MEAKSQCPKGREGAISTLTETIKTSNPVKIFLPAAKTIFGSVRTLRTLIRAHLLFPCNSPLQVHT